MTLHINQFSEGIFSASLFRKHKPKIFLSPRISVTPKRIDASAGRILLPSGFEGNNHDRLRFQRTHPIRRRRR